MDDHLVPPVDQPSAPVSGVAERRAIPWWAFLLWGCAGTLGALGVAAILSIGVFLLAAAAILAVVAVSLPGSRNASAVALVCGAGAPPLYVAWLNKDGPGTVCHAVASGSTCVDEWSPWPFLVVGAVLVVGGLLLARLVRPRQRPPR